jgi:hypothetical protein
MNFSIQRLGIIVTLAGVIGAGCNKPTEQTPAATTPAVAAPATAGATARPEFQKIVGRWLRPDGGYVIAVKSVAADGTLDAGYFNPNPIHVAVANVKQDGAETKVFVELRDVNYPGSTYNLVYQTANDRLVGVYYQAKLKESFEVYFERMGK